MLYRFYIFSTRQCKGLLICFHFFCQTSAVRIGTEFLCVFLDSSKYSCPIRTADVLTYDRARSRDKKPVAIDNTRGDLEQAKNVLNLHPPDTLQILEDYGI